MKLIYQHVDVAKDVSEKVKHVCFEELACCDCVACMWILVMMLVGNSRKQSLRTRS